MPDPDDLLLDLLLEWEDSWRDGQERSAEDLCADCPALLHELKSRIADAKRVEAFLAGANAEAIARAPSRLPTENEGRYGIVRYVAEGTSGVVYEAFDDTLSRCVAIKIQKGERDDLFLREARSVVQLDHPGIVRVYDVDRADDRRAFIVMEWVKGRTLQDDKERWRASTKVAQLLLQVTDAVAYAHRAKIVHRDLKPANILIDDQDRPRVADFGLAARPIKPGTLVGSPAYMSPEQVRGEGGGLDGRVDVWALGVILYELLAGRRPFQGDNCEKLFARILQGHPTPLRSVDRQVPAELERICERCLAADAEKRYPSASALAADLRHWLDRRRRLRRGLQLSAAALLIATAGIGSWAYQERAKRLASDVAFIARETEEGRQGLLAGDAQRGLPHLRDAYAVAARRGGADPALRFLLARANASARGRVRSFSLRGQFLSDFHVSPDGSRIAAVGSEGGARVWRVADGKEVFASPPAAGRVNHVAFSPGGSRLMWVSGTEAEVWDVASGKRVITCRGHDMDITWAAFSPDGRQIVTASVDNTARIWPDSGAAPVVLEGHRRSVVFAEFSPRGDRVITGSNDRTARLWDADSGKLLREFRGQHKGGVGFATMSDDGLSIVTVGGPNDPIVHLWNVGKGEPSATLDTGHRLLNRPAFTPEGGRCLLVIASARDGLTAQVTDLVTGKTLANLAGHSALLGAAQVSRDAKLVLTGSFDKSVRLWDLETATELWRSTESTADLLAGGKFTPDGSRLIISAKAGECKVMDLTRGALLADVAGQVLAATADQMIVRDGSGGIFACPVVDADAPISLEASRGATRAACSADGNWFVTASSEDDALAVWDVRSRSHRLLRGRPGGAGEVALDAAGRRLLVVSAPSNRFPDPRTYVLVDLQRDGDGAAVGGWESSSRPLALGFGRGDGDGLAATLDVRNEAVVVDVTAIGKAGGRSVCTLASPPRMPGSAAFSADATRLAVSDADGGAHVYDAGRGTLLASVRGHKSSFVNAVAFSPDGQLLATGGSDRSARVWDVTTAKLLVEYTAHTAAVSRVIWTPDGRRLLVSTADGRTRAWDVHLQTGDAGN
jgi:eukaryotic-like serine/threonine-protein kinase